MKSTKQDPKKNEFPKLQIAENKNVYLMTNSIKGTCVHSPCGDFLGTHTELYTVTFKDFNGSITLEN